MLCHRCEVGAEGESFDLLDNMLQIISPEEIGGMVGLSESEEKALMHMTEEYVHFHVQDQKPLVCWDFLRTLH